MELLLKRPNQLISKDLAEERIYKNNVDQNTLRNMIYRLRKKLNIEEQLIITIKDLGYMIKID